MKRLESEVTCPLCLDIFTEPKRLPCDHVYCRQCLRGLALRSTTGSISCPECRTDTPVPPNFDVTQFATPHQVNRLVEMYQQNLKLAETEAAEPQPATCKEHKSQPLALYCETCESLVCRDCALLSCTKRNHKHGFVEDMVKKYQTSLQSDLQPVRVLHQQMLTSLETISVSERKLEKATETKLQETEAVFSHLVQILAEEKQYITESIMASFKEQKKRNAAKKDEISAVLVKLESTLESMEVNEPSVKILESMATKRRDINTTIKEAGNVSQQPTELPQREAELLSPARFKEICSSSNFTYVEGDPVKGHFGRSVDQQSLPVNEALILHVVSSNSYFNEQKMKVCLRCRNSALEAVAVKRITPEQYSLSFVPQKRGRHELHIMYNDTHICGSPIPVYVTIPPQQLKEPISTMKIRCDGGMKCYRNKIYLCRDSEILVLNPSTRSIEMVIKVPGVNDILVAEEHIFATDVDQHRVVKMDRNGIVVKSVGGVGSNPGEFSFPNGIRQNKDKEIYVCDGRSNSRIQVFDEDLNLLRIIGKRGTSNGCFESPGDLDFDEAGNIYVVEQRNHRIQVLTPEGQHIRYIGRHGVNPGELSDPLSPAIHRNMIYVTEPFNRRVSVFTLAGEFVTTFGHKLSRPECIAIDEDGYIHVTSNEQVIVTF